MLFYEFNFWLFFLVVYALVITNAVMLRSVKLQTVILLLASYYFYAQWDYRFLSLIILSTSVDFIAGKQLTLSRYRGAWLAFSIAVNLGVLGVFKYFDFFQYEFASLLATSGLSVNPQLLGIVLPVGISFYTFQTMSYCLDIYRGKLQPCQSFLHFATFVAFFPQLVAGPIERARNMLPQFERLWVFDEQALLQGMRLILVGLLLKVGVADGIAPFVNAIFARPETYGFADLALGAVGFSVQVYADFCGYSTMAIGLAKLLGFELMSNFRTPFFAISQADLWHRWHISLSSFFRDYVSLPLARTRAFRGRHGANFIVTFAISGLWHGANWTFIVWGVYLGTLLAIEKQLGQNVTSARMGSAERLSRILLTFGLFCFGAIFFRSESLSHAWLYISSLIGNGFMPIRSFGLLPILVLWLAIDCYWRNDTRLEVPMTGLFKWRPMRWSAYSALVWGCLHFSITVLPSEYIYFQF